MAEWLFVNQKRIDGVDYIAYRRNGKPKEFKVTSRQKNKAEKVHADDAKSKGKKLKDHWGELNARNR